MAARGSIIQYHGPRGLIYRMKYRDATGKQVQETLGAAADGWTRKKAEAVLADRLAEVRAGYQQPKRALFADYARTWLDDHAKAKQLEEETRKGYESMIERHFVPFFGRMDLSYIEANPELIEKYIRKKGDGQEGEGLSPKTISNHLNLLHEMFKHAIRRRYIRTNPVVGVDRPSVWQKEATVLSQDEINRLIRALEEIEDEASDEKQPMFRTVLVLVTFILLSAFRRSEAFGLRWNDVDLDEGLVTVRRARVRAREKKTKTARSARTVQIGPYTVRLLREHRSWTPFSHDDDFVFCHPFKGTPLEGGNIIKHYLGPAYERAGIRGEGGSKPDFRPFHGLRATSLTHEARAGSCTQAVLLVHEFLSAPNPARAIQGTRSSLVERNAAAFADFARAVTADPSADVGKGHLLGPVAVPGDARVSDLPLLLGKARREVSWPDSGLVQDWDKVQTRASPPE